MVNDPRPQGVKASLPLARPDVPEFAERINILDHIRLQFHPIFQNAIGGPEINGPREYLGIEIRCPLCHHIHSLCAPGEEGKCPKCDLRYKYIAAKANTWLWVWKVQKKLDLDGPAGASAKPLIEIPIGGAAEVLRAYAPGKGKVEGTAAISQSGFKVNLNPKVPSNGT